MTQQNIYKLLKKKNKWMTSQEIAKILGINSGTVGSSLQKMYSYGEVLRKGNKRSRSEKNGCVYFLWRVK